MSKTVKVYVADGPFPELQPGDCLMVVELQRPAPGEAPYVGLEFHDAYPDGLDAGPFNEAHAGSPGDIERAVRLQVESAAARLGLRVVDAAAAAILDRIALVPRENVEWMAQPSLIRQISHVWQAELARRKALGS